ncbi:MAG: tRNA dihydrouridine synthase DusB [Puniceicoccales bacterium]|jgi:nifR3 family TIM-barrel protein|nr:tRNA dihydrouridine synthase DusB [Puniceicoccales bacterium]
MASSGLAWFGAGRFPLYLAPMAGHTDTAFRALCKEYGADVLVTEFVQAVPLVRDVARTWHTIEFHDAQRPVGVQIFGATPDLMARAAQLLEERLHPDFIDINFGCPAHKVVEQNAGAGLLRTPALLQEIARAVVRAVPFTPVTAKMRLGWDASSIVTVDAARWLEDAGVRAIAIHGRTRAQGYSGEADWLEIARAAAAVSVPVVGNGDIRDAATALLRQRESGVAGLMIGRAALGNPWLFSEIKAALRNTLPPAPPTDTERMDTLMRYARILAAEAAPPRPDGDVRWMLPRLFPLTQQIPGARKLRARLSACHTLDDILSL